MLGLKKTGCTDSAGLAQTYLVPTGHSPTTTPAMFFSASLCMAGACRGVLLTSGTPTMGASTPAQDHFQGTRNTENVGKMFDQDFTLRKVKLNIMKISILHCI